MDLARPRQSPAAHGPAPAYGGYALAASTSVHALNIADRLVVSTLIEPIKHEFALGDGAAGLLTVWAMGASGRRGWAWQSRFVRVTMVIAIIPALMAFLPRGIQLTLSMFWLFVPSVCLFIGPTLGLAQNLAPPGLRGLVCALILFVSNIANFVVAPVLIGFLSNAIGPRLVHPGESLRILLAAMSLTGLWAAWRFCAAASREETSLV